MLFFLNYLPFGWWEGEKEGWGWRFGRESEEVQKMREDRWRWFVWSDPIFWTRKRVSSFTCSLFSSFSLLLLSLSFLLFLQLGRRKLTMQRMDLLLLLVWSSRSRNLCHFLLSQPGRKEREREREGGREREEREEERMLEVKLGWWWREEGERWK